VLLFLGSFVLTVGGFVVTTVVIRARAEQIRAAADRITTNAAPSITKLTSMRTSLRHLEVLLDDCIDQSVFVHGECDPIQAVRTERESIRAEWQAYRRLPTFEGERGLWPGIQAGFEELDEEVLRAQAALSAEDPGSAMHELEGTVKPMLDQLDGRLARAIVLNANGSEEAAAQIRRVQLDIAHESMLLEILCALCGLIATVIAIRVATASTRLLEDQVDQLEMFSGRVAHDLLSPLSSIGLALELAARRTDDNTQELLAHAKRTLGRTRELVDGLLLLASTLRKPVERGADVKAVLEDVVEEFKTLAEEKNVRIELSEVSRALVAASGGVLANIVGNLLSNAIKYMGDSAVRQVWVRAIDVGRALRVEVEDTGPGIPEAIQATIFEPYVRAAPPHISGLGLGLATVRRLAELLGGRVGLDSSQSGGTVAWVELPRWVPVEAPASPRRKMTV
jgi:signal transduction histidine kinase